VAESEALPFSRNMASTATTSTSSSSFRKSWEI